jgi:hypothetical protein
MSEGPRDRRNTDPLLENLIREVQGFRQDMKPIREFMSQVDASKKAAIWTVSILAAIGAALKWAWEARDHFPKGGH